MATKYVRSFGSNAHGGTNDTSDAYLTLAYALDHSSGSDVIDMQEAHTFVEGTVWMSPAGSQVIHSGSAGNPTRVIGLGAGITAIQGDFYLRGLDYFQFENLTIDQNNTADGNEVCVGIAGNVNHFKLIDCEVKNAYSSNIYVDAAIGEPNSDIQILRGSNHASGQRGANPIAPSHGVYLASYVETVTDVLLEGCELYDHWADPNSFAFQTYDANAHKLTHFTARYNIVHDCANGAEIGDGADHKLYENLFYDIGVHGGNGDGVEVGFGSSSDAKVYSNVFINLTGEGLQVALYGSVSNLDAANNIFVNVSGYAIHVYTGSGHLSRTNLFFNCGGTVLADVGSSITETGSVSADPLFVDDVGPVYDFHLQTLSPAREAGTDLSAVFTDDIEGNLRTAPWWIGPYQDALVVITPPPPDPVLDSDIAIPIYALLLTNLDGSDDGIRFTTGPTNNGGAFDTADPLLIPIEITRACDPREARFNTSSCTVQLIDIDGAITEIVSTLAGKLATLYVVDWGADFSTKMTIFVGIVQDFAQTDRGYSLRIASPIVLADKTLFDSAKTQIHTTINNSVTSIVVEDASGWQDMGYILSGSERMSYISRTDGGATWTLGGVTRGINGSVAASHAAGDAIEEMFILGPAHPYDILQDLFSNPATSKTGLGMANFIDTANIAAQKIEIGSTLEMKFEITRGENAKAWIEREIMRATAAYPFETMAGLVSIKAFSTIAMTVGAIIDADCRSWAQWRGNFPKRVNSVTVLYDYDLLTDKPASTFTYRDDGLFVRDGDFPLLIEARGIHTGLTATSLLLTNRTLAYVARFGLQLPTIAAETLFSKNTLNVADDIATTFRRLVNVGIGSIGLSSAPAEIIALVMRLSGGSSMEFEIFSQPPIFEVLVPDGEPGVASDVLATALTSTPTVAIA